jgi:guanylate kinase
MSKQRGTLYVIAAPSGGGKTSLVNALVRSLPNLVISVSYTTRPKRPNEENGIHYWFIAEAEFQRMINEGVLLEHALVFGYHYGTSRSWVEHQLEQGIDVILEIDWQGARQIRQQFAQIETIFILPPSLEQLKDRLENRNQDHAEVISRRLEAATEEMSHCDEFDYLIINDDFDAALRDLQAIIRSRRLTKQYQMRHYGEFICHLMEE